MILVLTGIGYSNNFQAFAEEKTVSIPFGAFNPELNTPVEVWYDPPTILIKVGDIITWTNDDREGHTVTSGQGSGRFGWMSDDFGTADGFFDSGRFMPGEEWSHSFEEEGTFQYFCVIHPWMEAFVIVEPLIPDYPHDATGKKLGFPILQITPDKSVEINFSWEPKVIKTHEKVNFIYRFYDGVNDLPLRKLEYDISIIQNGQELYRDENTVSSAGGAYRQWIFEEPGPIIVKFRNIESFGMVGGTAITLTDNPIGRIADFTAMVYENTETFTTTDKIVQPKETLQFYYEIAVVMILVPAAIFIYVLWSMKSGGKTSRYSRKATPI